MSLITPSLPARSFDELQTLVTALAGVAPLLQVDIVDGVFATPASWPFSEPKLAAEWVHLVRLREQIAFEIDCMVDRPEQYLEQLLRTGAEAIIVHMGSTEAYGAIAAEVRAAGGRAGLALMNDTSKEAVFALVPLFDFVQVMGIREVGVQGQPFDERTPDTVKALRDRFPELEISIDGAVNAATIPRLAAAGATRFAPGSAISRAADPRTAYEELRQLAGST